MYDINVQMMDLKTTKVKETVTCNEDGSYTIFLNTRFTQEQLNDAYIHALNHIIRGKLPTNRRLMNNALSKLHYITSLLILIGLFFMPIFKKG